MIVPEEEGELAGILADVGVGSVDDLPHVPIWDPSTDVAASASLPRQKIDRTAPTFKSAAQLVKDFKAHLETLRVQMDDAVALDLLAAYLSSQFLLFAGPSGTGKSTAALALQTFFAPVDSRAVIPGRRQLMGPEDLVGFYSPLGGVFVAGPDLDAIDRIARPSPSAASPSLLVEEINLSAPEGYLNPLIHGLSGTAANRVVWKVFADELTAAAERSSQLVLEPFPRLLGTINVDSTALAPAPKVAARACVLLLEPVETTALASVVDSMSHDGTSVATEPAGALYVHSPHAVLRSPDFKRTAVETECLRLAALPEHGADVFGGEWVVGATPVTSASRRQLAQMVLFTSWYALLAEGAGLIEDSVQAARLGAENSVLHFMLPSQDPVSFTRSLERVRSAVGALSTRESSSVGGLLSERVDRLGAMEADAGFSGRVLDFWDRLS